MKTIIIIVFAFFMGLCAQAQDIVEKSVPAGKSSRIDLDFQFADQIIIKNWDKNEAYVKATVNINDNEDNDKFSLTATEDKGGVKMKSDIDDLEGISHEKAVYRHGEIVRNDHCVNMEIDFEIFLPPGSRIHLETISGDVEIMGFNDAMQINTISGFIDVTVDPAANLDFSLETITGEFYANLDLDRENKTEWKNHWIGGKLETKLNGGGPLLELETISGNIYLRKE